MNKTKQQLMSENEELKARLTECEDTLEAIRTGAVDAFVVSDGEGEKIFSLQSVDYSYRVMVENMIEGAVTLDKNGLIVFANKAFADLSGLDLTAVVGVLFRDFLAAPQQDGFPDFLHACRLRPCREEFMLACTHDTTLPVSISGTVYTIDQTTQNFCCIINDLRERKAAENRLRVAYEDVEQKVVERTTELQQSEARFRSVLDNSLDVIYRLNAQSGCYEYLSPSSEMVMGYLPAELMQQDAGAARAMVHPDDLPAFRTAQARLMETGSATADYRQQTKSGEYRWISNQMSLTKDSAGRVVYRDGTIRNITVRKQAEAERERLLDEITERADKSAIANKELEAFSYSVSHDLRNPLSSIGSNLELLAMEMEIKPDTVSHQAITYILQNVDRMASVIKDLLLLSGISRKEIQVENVDLSQLTQFFIAELKVVDPHRTIRITIPSGLTVHADPGLLRLLVDNLIRNAWKFTSKKEVAHIELGALDKDGKHCFFIRDNGIGFDMRESDRLFKPYERLHAEKEFKGSGIGLAIAKRIVEKHNGAIWAESEKSKGATFYFCLA